MLVIGLGIFLFVAGVGLRVIQRTAPDAAVPTGPLPGAAVALILLGGALFCLGLAPVLFGNGSNSQARVLPLGSHRSIIGTTAVGVVAAAMVASVFFGLAPGSIPQSTGGFLFILLTLEGALVGLAYIQGVRAGLINRQTLGLAGNPLQRGMWWGLVGGFVLLLFAALNNVVLRLLGVEQPQVVSLAWLKELPRGEYLLIAAAGAGLAPMVEELFFRGYVFNAYLAEKGRGSAYLASSVLFALVHAQPVLVLALFAMGLVLAAVYRRSGTIVAPIVAHVLNNGIAFLSLAVAPR